MSVLIGLISPLAIGYADHVGVNLGRRGRLMAAILWIYIFTLVSSAILALLWGESPPPPTWYSARPPASERAWP